MLSWAKAQQERFRLMAYSITFKIKSSDLAQGDALFDKAVLGLQNNLSGNLDTSSRRKNIFKQSDGSTIDLTKEKMELRVRLNAADQVGVQRQLEAFLEQFNSHDKLQLLTDAAKQQRSKSSKALLMKMKGDFTRSLEQSVDQQTSPLLTGPDRSLTNMHQQKRQSAPNFVPSPTQGLNLSVDTGPLVDMKALKRVYEALLKEELKKLNGDDRKPDEYAYEVAKRDDLLVFSLKNKSDDNLQITLDHGFHAHSKIVNNDNVAMLMVSARAYIRARQETSPEANFNGFVLTCETMKQALVLREQFKQQEIPLQNILISQAKQDEPRFLKPALLGNRTKPVLEEESLSASPRLRSKTV